MPMFRAINITLSYHPQLPVKWILCLLGNACNLKNAGFRIRTIVVSIEVSVSCSSKSVELVEVAEWTRSRSPLVVHRDYLIQPRGAE